MLTKVKIYFHMRIFVSKLNLKLIELGSYKGDLYNGQVRYKSQRHVRWTDVIWIQMLILFYWQFGSKASTGPVSFGIIIRWLQCVG